MRITLNLATRPFADLGPAMKRLRIAMAVLAAIAIGLGFGLRAFHQKAEAARARDHSLDGQIAHITSERQQYENMMRLPANAQVVKNAVALNKLFDEKAFSWTLAMEDLETVLPGGVQVSTLEPVRDEKKEKTTLNLRVIGPRNLAIDLVRNLEHSKRFLQPKIVGENDAATGAPGEQLQPVSESNRVNFDLLADYNPATAEERKAYRRRPAVSEDSEWMPATHVAPLPLTPPHGPVRMPYTGPPRPVINDSRHGSLPNPAPPGGVQ